MNNIKNKFKNPKFTIYFIACAVLLIVSVVFFILTDSSASAYQDRQLVNNSQIDTLMKQYESAGGKVSEASSESEEQSVVSSTDTLRTCARQGNEVAALQTKYQNFKYTAKNKQERESYESSLRAYSDDIKKYFDGDDGLCGTKWYSPTDNTSFVWEFKTTQGFKGSSTDVLWVCHINDKSDNLSSANVLAYATAKYNVSTDRFTNLEIHLTSLGREKQQAVES